MPKATAVVITSNTKSNARFKKPIKPLADDLKWLRGRERYPVKRKLLTIDGVEIKLLFDKTEEEKRLDRHFNAACPFFKLEKKLNKSGRKKKYKRLAISII